MNKKLLSLLVAMPLILSGALAQAQSNNHDDPFAGMTDAQIDNLTDQERDKVNFEEREGALGQDMIDQYEGVYDDQDEYDEYYDDEEYDDWGEDEYYDEDDFDNEENYDNDDFFGEGGFDEEEAYWNEVDSVITDQDWDTLSDKQIDEKLESAGIETFADPQDPLYDMTPDQIDNLSDEEWEQIDAQYEELYGDEDFDEEGFDDESFDDEDYEDFDFDSEKSDMIDEVNEVFTAIKSELDTDTATEIEDIIESLDSISDEDEFFDALDEAYELATDEIEAYFEAEYGDEFDNEDFDDEHGHSHDHDADYEADADVVYSVTAGENFTVVSGSENAEAKQVVQLLKDISPNSLSDNYLSRLVLYTDTETGEGASVGLADDGTWDMAVNMDVLHSGGLQEMKATLVHEMAHILTLN